MKENKLIFILFITFLGAIFLGCSSDNSVNIDESAILSDCPTSLDEATPCSKTGVMLQAFNWNSCKVGVWYTVISNNASDIKANFEYAWFPPSSDSTSPNGYLPRKLNTLSSEYGTETALKTAISDIAPTKAIADIVINHRCGTTSWGDFTEPSWGVVKGSSYKVICSNDEGFTNDSNMTGISKENKGNKDTGDGYESGRDIDHTNSTVKVGITTWMIDKLKDAGFVGWRYDFVKGYHGRYVGYYNAQSGANFSVGEYWPTAGFSSTNPSAWQSQLETWVGQTSETIHQVPGKESRVFDFVLKGIMNTVFGTSEGTKNSNYKLLASSASIMRSMPENAVTFIDNHDTGSTQSFWPLDPQDIGTAYALILTHPGYPCVAWQHYFSSSESSDTGSQYCGNSTVPDTTLTYKSFITQLITLRKNSGIGYDSAISVVVADDDKYVAKITGTSNELLVLIGTGYTAGSEYTQKFSGTNFTIWQK